jgi:hypothetical protein
MKKFTLILFLTALLTNLSLASNGYNKAANYYLNDNERLVLRIPSTSIQKFNEIKKVVSVIKKRNMSNGMFVLAYANKKQFQNFLKLHVDYQVTKSDNSQLDNIDCSAPVPDLPTLPNATGQCSVTLTPPTATSDCYGPIEGTTSTVTFSSQGTFFVTWLYDDGHGNTSTQTQSVIINDTTAPVPNVSSLPTITAQCSATVIAPTATDNCSGTVTATTTSPFTYSEQGTYEITWTYNDGQDNIATQTQTVIIDDTLAPVPNITSLPTISGQCSVTVSPASATDNCSGTILGTTSDPLTYNIEGNYVITWTYTDAEGNSSTQQQTVTVNDTFAPVPDITSLPTITEACSATITNSPTATDNCIGSVTGTTSDPLTYNTAGNHTITWTYNDGNGNTSTQTQTIIITIGGSETTYYQDTDNDGFGNEEVFIQSCSQPEGYVSNADDCDDTQLLYEDNDGDNFGSIVLAACGASNSSDCDDTNAAIGSYSTFYQDNDGDGFGNEEATIQACSTPEGYTDNADDCDDTSLQYEDNDGDGLGSNILAGCGVENNIDCDDNDVFVNFPTTYYQDADGDGFGTGLEILPSCTQPEGYVTNDADCDDTQILYVDADGDGAGSTTPAACGVANSNDCDDNNAELSSPVTFYQDSDNDGFGDPLGSLTACFQPFGFADNDDDCNDNLVQYADNDGDGYGSTTMVACNGVTNTDDLDDNDPNSNNSNTYYQDLDGDGFGNPAVSIMAASQPVGYVSNNIDCNDNQIQYLDTDEDGFGSTTQVACGVANSTDCDDNLLTYADVDGDGFGAQTLAACGTTDNSDCDDNQIQYLDTDEDGFGSTTQVACGVTNNIDCNDNLLTYADVDGDGFGAQTLAACGTTDNSDCDDNQIEYLDNDNDGFGSTTQVACGVANNTDCDDNQIQFADIDGDGFGSTTMAACGVMNSIDCNDNQIQYLDNDGDTFGSSIVVACGVANNYDCDDSNAAVKPLALSKLNQAIYANAVSGAQGYRFRVTNLTTNQVATIDRTLRTFNLTQVSNHAYNTVFYVEVAVRVNNVWSGFTRIPACSVITPIVTTRLQSTQCGITITNLGTTLYAIAVPNAPGYRFRITESTNPNNTQIFNSVSRTLKFSFLTGIEFNKTYIVEVAALNPSGPELPYGQACNITTLSATTRIDETNEASKEFNAIVAPNPFATSFNLKVDNYTQETISIQVYDLMGRLVENNTINVNDLENTPFGANYPSGVYTMIVSNASEIKNIRIVKR